MGLFGLSTSECLLNLEGAVGVRMPTEIEPRIGEWYKDVQLNLLFEVVAIDEADESIEIQYSEGDVEEIDLDSWFEMDLVMAEPPEDWSASYGSVEKEDLGYSDSAIHPEDWSGPLTELDRQDVEFK